MNSDSNDSTPVGPGHDVGPGDDGPGFPAWLKWGLLGALAVLVVGYGLIFLYAKVLNDSPDELDTGDLDAALADEPAADEPATDDEVPPDTTVVPDGSTTPSTVTEPSVTTAPPAAVDTGAGDGTVWSITDPSELGYRVEEVLFGVDTEAVGRTDQVIGSIVIDGTAVTSGEFVVDVASIESDEGRRDNQFRGRIMETDRFPEAVFVLTEPIDLGLEPVEGAEVETTATGELTLRGVTNTVTFDLTARLENDRIGVLGQIPVLFEDYDIPNPSFGGITTEDNGLLEFVLVFERT